MLKCILIAKKQLILAISLCSFAKTKTNIIRDARNQQLDIFLQLVLFLLKQVKATKKYKSFHPPSPYFFYFSCFYAYLMLDKGQACPAGLGKMFSQCPPAGARIRKNEKSKIRGGTVICAPRTKHWRVPVKKIDIVVVDP